MINDREYLEYELECKLNDYLEVLCDDLYKQDYHIKENNEAFEAVQTLLEYLKNR